MLSPRDKARFINAVDWEEIVDKDPMKAKAIKVMIEIVTSAHLSNGEEDAMDGRFDMREAIELVTTVIILMFDFLDDRNDKDRPDVNQAFLTSGIAIISHEMLSRCNKKTRKRALNAIREVVRETDMPVYSFN